MNIRDVNAAAIARTYTRQAGTADGGAGRTGMHGVDARPRTDSVSLSSTRHEVMSAQSAALAQPDVRADKVAALKQQIAAGTYNVDTQTLAARMLG
jgi:negative regulator of flagellin synthesis FlgM